MNYLTKLHDFGVVNIEMESTIFAALTHHAGIRAAVVCVTLLDRLKGDQVRYFNFTKIPKTILFDCVSLMVIGKHTERSNEWMAKKTTNSGVPINKKTFGARWSVEVVSVTWIDTISTSI